MAAPFGSGSRFDSADLKGVPIFYHPFEFLTFFHLQRSRQRCRTDEVILAILTAPLNHLQFRKVTHVKQLAI